MTIQDAPRTRLPATAPTVIPVDMNDKDAPSIAEAYSRKGKDETLLILQLEPGSGKSLVIALHHQRQTAKALGLTYDQLRHCIRKHGLSE